MEGVALRQLYFPVQNEAGELTLKVNAPVGDIYRLMGLGEEGEWTLLERLNQLEASEDDVEVDLKAYVLSGICCVRLDYSYEYEDARARYEFFRAKWESNRPDSYSLLQTRLAAFYGQDHLIEVVGEEVAAVYLTDTGLLAEESRYN